MSPINLALSPMMTPINSMMAPIMAPINLRLSPIVAPMERYGTISGTMRYYIEMVYILSEHSLKENESPNENYNGN